MQLEKVIATMVSKNKMVEMSGNTKYIKYSVAINDEYHFITSFSGTAQYLGDYAKVGAKLFFESWRLVKKEKAGRTYYDFIADKVSIVKNGEDK